MVEGAHVSDLLPGYALGCLDPADETRVSDHLATCASCRTELQSFQVVTDQLGLAVPDVPPPDRLKRELIARIQPPQPTARGEPRRSWWAGLQSLWQRAAPAWGLVSLLLILALGVQNLMLRQEPDEPQMTSGGMRIVTLQGTEAAPDATGTLVISTDGEHGTLVVDSLPPLDPALQYQLWLIKDGQRTNGGVFSVDDAGYGALWIYAPAPLSSYPGFGITVEPAGGSPGPTGEKVLGGSL